MMRRQHSVENRRDTNNNNNSNSNSNNRAGESHSMNPNGNVGMSHNARRSSSSGGGGNRASFGGGGSSGSNMSVSEQIRQRFSHHSASGDVAAAGGSMNDYQVAFSHPSRTAAAFGSFGHPNSLAGASGMGMNPAMNMNMNPAFYAAAGLQHHQSPQQASLGEHFGVATGGGDHRGAGGSGIPSAAAANQAMGGGSLSQAEQEEELLLNLLIARRRRQQQAGMRPDQQQMGPHGGGGAGLSTTWSEDFMRLRGDPNGLIMQQQEHMMGNPGGGDGGPYDPQGDNSYLSYSAASQRMGMNQLSNVNMNMNMNMPGAAGSSQFLSESSRMLRGGSGVGLQMGSPQGAWLAGNSVAMQSQPHTPFNDGYAHHRQDMNAQVGNEVLERVEQNTTPSNMIRDARSADQGSMLGQGFNQYHSMGGRAGIAQLQDPSLAAYAKRSRDGKVVEKSGKHHLQLPTEEANKPSKRQHKKKPKDMPRRPLSAYNLFFSEERERILREIEGKSGEEEGTEEGKNDEESEPPGKKSDEEDVKPKALLRPLLASQRQRRPHRKSHGKISFKKLATMVGQRWKALPDDRRKYYQDLAQEDMKRQKKAMEEYYQKRSALTGSETKE